VICRIHDRMVTTIPLVLAISFLRLLFAGIGARLDGLCWGRAWALWSRRASKR
jgi:hypothetical protein